MNFSHPDLCCFQLIQGHRIVLLDMMKRIIKDSDDALDIDLSKELIQLASSELTKSKVSTVFKK